VLAGSFTEASFAGRMPAVPGDVLLHGRFDCHMDVGHSRKSLQILRLPWLNDAVEGHFRTQDPEQIVRLAERDPLEAMVLLARDLRPVLRRERHWTEELAADLTHDSMLPLRTWAARRGIPPHALSRGFQREFGVSAKLFRLEARARRAWRTVLSSDHSLTCIAHDTGFADLAHMSRSIRAFTGLAPTVWRESARTDAMRNAHRAGI
jgi:AraC-like DNA-binding protein